MSHQTILCHHLSTTISMSLELLILIILLTKRIYHDLINLLTSVSIRKQHIALGSPEHMGHESRSLVLTMRDNGKGWDSAGGSL